VPEKTITMSRHVPGIPPDDPQRKLAIAHPYPGNSGSIGLGCGAARGSAEGGDGAEIARCQEAGKSGLRSTEGAKCQ
jgi:hypothetical protein